MSDDTPAPIDDDASASGSRLDAHLAALSGDTALLVRKVVRILITALVCIAAWLYLAFLVYLAFADRDTYVLFIVLLALPLVIAGTVVGIAAIRSARVRSAIAPFELAAWIGVAVWLSTIAFPDDDPYSGQEFFAVGYAVASALVLTFVVLVARGRARERSWYLGAAGVLLVIGLLIGPVQRAIDGASIVEPARELPLMALGGAFGPDGAYSLSADPTTVAVATTLDAGYEPDASAAAAAYPTAAMVDPVGVTADPVGVQAVAAFGDVDLRVLPDDSLRLDVQPQTAVAGSRLVGAIRRGSCGAPRRTIGAPIRLRAGAVTRAVLPISLDELGSTDSLVFVAGTGEALAPVRCMSLIDPVALRTAKLGAAAFGARCIAPLHLAPAAQAVLNEASFQDPTCARDWSRLEQVATAQWVQAARVPELRSCIAASGSGVALQLLDDGSALIDADTYADPVVSECVTSAVTTPVVPAAPPIAPAATQATATPATTTA